MADLCWQDAFQYIQPYIVLISTTQGTGTGFLLSYTLDKKVVAIATAAHVINYADEWDQPIRIEHLSSNSKIAIKAGQRATMIDNASDSAIIICNKEDMGFPEKPLELIEKDKYLKIGTEVGWLGYPGFVQKELCFFSGRVSCWREKQKEYFIDGVAINGVSGGPSFFALSGTDPLIIGIITAYIPNMLTGETLPGLSIVRDVSKFHEFIENIHSIEEAIEKEKEINESIMIAPSGSK